MALFLQEPEAEPIREADLPAPLGQVVRAQAAQAWDELPLISSTRKAVELDLARTRYAWASPKVKPDQVGDFLEQRGLPRDSLEARDYNELELNILAGRKRRELERRTILERDPGGFVNGSARLATALGVSVLDPLNVASAFVPVIGEERYAALVARQANAIGRAGVRVGVGAAEGTVGAAALEPLTYAVHQQEQADYTLTDSLLNVGFGAVFGGVLHAGVGGLHDLSARARVRQVDRILAGVETPEPARGGSPVEPATVDTRATVDVSELRYISKQVDEAVAAREKALDAVANDPASRAVADRLDIAQADGRAQGLQQQLDTVSKTLAETREKQVEAEFQRLKSDPAFMAGERKRLNASNIDDYVQARAARTIDAERARLQDQAEALRNEIAPLSSDLATLNRVRAAEADLESVRYARNSAKSLDDKLAALTPELRDSFQRRIDSTLRDIIPASEKIDRLPQTSRDALMRAAIAQTMSDQPIRIDSLGRIDDRPAAAAALKADAEHAAHPDNSPLANVEAIKAADEQAAAVKADTLAQATSEADEAEALLKDALATLGDVESLPAEIRAELDAAAEFAGDVDTMKEAATMMVQCALRHAV